MIKQNKYVAPLSEFIGTAILATVVLAVSGRSAMPYETALFSGITLALLVLIFGPFSGAHINPVVTIGMWTVKKIQTSTAIVYIGAQMLGGFAALQMNEMLIDTTLSNRAGKEFDWRVLVAEAIGAAIFTFAVAAAVGRSRDQNKTAIMAGGGLMLGIIAASLVSNGILNPAVAVGVRSWSLAYAVGPVLGAIIGMNIYSLIFSPVELGRSVWQSVSKKSKTKATPKKTAKRKK